MVIIAVIPPNSSFATGSIIKVILSYAYMNWCYHVLTSPVNILHECVIFGIARHHNIMLSFDIFLLVSLNKLPNKQWSFHGARVMSSWWLHPLVLDGLLLGYNCQLAAITFFHCQKYKETPNFHCNRMVKIKWISQSLYQWHFDPFHLCNIQT